MPEGITRTKIKEALEASGSNRQDALKLLITWAIRNPPLLLAMTKPHLKAIAASQIDHYLRRESGESTDDAGPDAFSRTAIDDIVESTRSPTDRRGKSTIPPPKSTERQASAMRKLAAAFTHKKK